MTISDQIKQAASAKDPQAALEEVLKEIQARHKASDEMMAEQRPAYTERLSNAMQRREKMAELWPDAPPHCYIYASFCRPFGEYGRAPASVQEQQHHRADWSADIPHSYVASLEPLELPQVDLLRVPLT